MYIKIKANIYLFQLDRRVLNSTKGVSLKTIEENFTCRPMFVIWMV